MSDIRGLIPRHEAAKSQLAETTSIAVALTAERKQITDALGLEEGASIEAILGLIEWQPIETAGKGYGDQCLALHDGFFVSRAYFDHVLGWCVAGSEGRVIEPTHWKPLPNPPKVQP